MTADIRSIPEHLADRSEEILDQIRLVVLERGFERSSMQQLARAAQMSAGNFYRYFPSKDAIIAALVDRDLKELEARFAEIKVSNDPRQAFRQLIQERVQLPVCCKGGLLLEIEAASLHSAEIESLLRRLDHELKSHVLAVFKRIRNSDEGERTTELDAMAGLIILMVKGVIRASRHARTDEDHEHNAELGRLIIRQIDQLVEEAARHTPANQI